MSRAVFRKGVGTKILIGALVFFCFSAIWVAMWSRQNTTLEQVRLGIDRCDHCGMIVSDIRYSVSVLDKDAQGHSVTRHFDDVGCFQTFANERSDQHWVGVAHDFETSQEISLDDTQFKDIGAATPMGSGIVAAPKTK